MGGSWAPGSGVTEHKHQESRKLPSTQKGEGAESWMDQRARGTYAHCKDLSFHS